MLIFDVEVGTMFIYEGALFVVLPFDWEEKKYFNLCISADENLKYDRGAKYFFDNLTEVTVVEEKKLKKLF